MNILCKIFWHRMYFNGCDIGGPSHCVRWKCDYKEPAMEWPKPPPMPKGNLPKPTKLGLDGI